MKGFIHQFSNSSNKTLEYFKNTLDSKSDAYTLYYCICEVLAECVYKHDGGESFSIFVSVISQKTGMSFRKTSKLLKSLPEIFKTFEKNEQTFEKNSKVLKTFDFQISYFPEIIDFSKLINRTKVKELPKTPKVNKENDSSLSTRGVIPPPDDPCYDALRGAYGERLVLSEYASQREYYENNPMRKSFLRFFTDGLERVDKWRKQDSGDDFDVVSATSLLKELEAESN